MKCDLVQPSELLIMRGSEFTVTAVLNALCAIHLSGRIARLRFNKDRKPLRSGGDNRANNPLLNTDNKWRT